MTTDWHDPGQDVCGVDGCPAGWIAVFIAAAGPVRPRVTMARRFAEAVGRAAVVAVDMPIGLPERIGRGGRGPETLVRPLIGARQSSVFAVPSRAAVHADSYAEACRLALETSDPPRRVSKQAFHLFPKIREVDLALRADPLLASRVFEVHPEVAFWRLNGGLPLALPKKVRSSACPSGLDLRRDILVRHGFSRALLARAPRGAGPDDLLDACANALIARRIRTGEARPFPDPPARDGHGLAVAIWA